MQIFMVEQGQLSGEQIDFRRREAVKRVYSIAEKLVAEHTSAVNLTTD